VERSDNEDTIGFLKFVEDGNDEIEILKYLSQFESTHNHAVRLTHDWRITGGQMMLTPIVGAWLTSLHNKDDNLWTVAEQLFNAVAFLHEHNVAHMDLKPVNILIPRKSGRLTLIDFGCAIRVRDAEEKFRGTSGTKGYMAPEIGKGSYRPIKADLWSCGKVIQTFCAACKPSILRDNLLKIADELLNVDPDKRPTMKQVLSRIPNTVVTQNVSFPESM